jgi:hypothetical protein
MDWASARINAQGSRRATWKLELLMEISGLYQLLCRGFQFRIEVGNDVLEGRDCLLNRGNLHQFPAAHRTPAVLERDNEVPALFLKLNKR